MHITPGSFLESLFTEGRVRVARPADVSEKELCELDQRLATFEAQYREELPGVPPPLVPEAARWGALMFFRACQFVAFRDLGAAEIDRTLGGACPGDDLPAVHYSVDLTFRYLPDLARLARNASQGDPLLAALARWADQWPLSSVGIAGARHAAVEAIAGHPCLLRLYVDRVISRRDTSRLADCRVRDGVREALGAFPELAAEMASPVEAIESQTNGGEGKGNC